jgi:hypothetical protein
VPGARGAFQFVGDVGYVHLHFVPEAERIHLVDPREEQQIAARLHQPRVIGFRRARITREILARPELRRVDEAADHDALRMPSRNLHQREMSVVEIAHGGHEGDALARQSPGAHGLAQVGDAFDAVHHS